MTILEGLRVYIVLLLAGGVECIPDSYLSIFTHYRCRNGDPGIAWDGDSEHLIGRSPAAFKNLSPHLLILSATSSVAFVLILFECQGFLPHRLRHARATTHLC